MERHLLLNVDKKQKDCSRCVIYKSVGILQEFLCSVKYGEIKIGLREVWCLTTSGLEAKSILWYFRD